MNNDIQKTEKQILGIKAYRPITFLTVALVLTWVTLIWFGWYAWSSYQKTKTDREYHLKIEKLRFTIIHLDEVLTMSARMAAATGNMLWEERYRIFEPKLAAAIEEAMDLASEAYSGKAAAETDAANIRLVEMENRSFNLIRHGKEDEAKALLFSDEYEKQKRIYSQGMTSFAAGLSFTASTALKREKRAAFLYLGMVSLLIPLLITAWIVTFRVVCSWEETLISKKELQKEITERKKTEEALKESEERFRIMATTATDAIIIMDNNRNISYWNSAAEELFGYSIQEAIGKELHMLLAPEKYHDAFRKGLNEFRKTGEGGAVGKTLELEAVRKDGTEFPIELSMSSHQLKGHWHAVGIMRDITERKRMEEELKRCSFIDALTGVANRRRFDEVLGLEWKRMTRNAKPLSLIMCDVDFFKAYNDTYGHQGGDDSLRRVANTLNSVFGRPGDLVARYGGEEFAVILPETDSQDAQFIAEKMRVCVESLGIIHVSSQVCEVVTISLGVATAIPTRGSLPDELISAADQALYEAKKEGRNRVNLAE